MKIVIDRDIPYIKGAFEPTCEVVYEAGDAITREMVADADALIVRTRTRCDRELLEGSSVKVISTATIGTDHIDLEWCKGAGIEVCSAAGCNARGVLQWVSAALVKVCRHLGRTPESLTLGVVGVGHVGSLVVEYARSWGFEVLCCDPPRARREGEECFVSIEEIARRADIITLHVPFTREGSDPTAGLVSGSIVDMMRPEVVVLNSSRGGVIDEQALLTSGHTLCIDTWMGEPEIDDRVLAAALLATPHIAGYSREGKAMATRMASEAVAQRLNLSIEFSSPLPTSVPRAITWNELCESINSYFDIEAETAWLKLHPESFEQLRNNYPYRAEFF